MAAPLPARAAAAAAVTGPAPQPAPGAKSRFAFIDLLRGCALIVMVEAHVVNAYLQPGLRHGTAFFWISFLNGLVAPAFLFASGFSMMLQGRRCWDDWLHFRAPFWRQMRRLGFITLVAYYSHIDDFKLSRYLNAATPNLWRTSLQVDILQCIVASLLVVHVLIVLLRTPVRVAWGAGALALAMALATPWMWAQDFTGRVPLALALFLNPHGISLFPLFPWLCFFLAGTCAAIVFLRTPEGERKDALMRLALCGGAVMIVAALLGRNLPFSLPGKQNFFTTSPLYLAVRLGCVVIVGAGLYFLERAQRWIPKPVQVVGQESLMVYGVHLWLIYGFLRGKRLGPVLGLHSGYLVSLAVSAALAVFMIWLARYWHILKRDYPGFTKTAQAAAIIGFIVTFINR
jgi:uncharacterized membrane protein